MSESPARPTASSTGAPAAGAAAPATDHRAHRAPLITVLGILALLALFLGVVYYAYVPHQTGAFIDDGIRTAEQRRQALAELQDKDATQLTSYAWVDQTAGVVQLPLERAMELTLEQYQKQTR